MPGTDFEWKKIVRPIMELYAESTDGSSIEYKESALVWHYQDSDHDFGACQAKELLDHLENVLANEPVVVKRGKHIVEVKPPVTFLHPVVVFVMCCATETNVCVSACNLRIEHF